MHFLVVRNGEAILKQMVKNTKHTWFMTSTAVLTYMKLIQFGIFWVLLLITLPNIYKSYRERSSEITLTFSESEYSKVSQNIFQISCNANMKNICLSISEVNNSWLNGELETKTSLIYSNKFFAKFRVLLLCCFSVALVLVNQTVQLFDGSSPLRRCQYWDTQLDIIGTYCS